MTKTDAMRRKVVNVRCFQNWMPGTTELIMTLVVTQEENDIRSAGTFRRT
jgi:hypothetical protein